jgi:hypothetical protein
MSSPDRSRPASRMEASRAPSMARSGYDSRSTSRGPDSRSGSPTPSYYYSNLERNHTNYNASTTRPTSRATTPTTSQQQFSTFSSSEYQPSVLQRSPSPLRTTYTEVLCTASRRLRERSIPPQPLLPEKMAFVRPPPLSGKPPPAPRVVASDFYRGKVKSIYEREALFTDFCRTIPNRHGNINIYNSATLDTLKGEFKSMVEDKWKRKGFNDPSVEHDFGTKVYPWRDVVMKEREPASSRIFRNHDARPRATTPVSMPRVYVYHRSTLY